MEILSIQKARISLIAIVLLGVVGVTIRSFFVLSSQGDSEVSSKKDLFEFPATIPLKEWQMIDSKLAPSEIHNIQVYQYQNNGEKLEIKTSYRQYDGANVSRLLFKEAKIPPATVVMNIKNQEGIGHYGMFQYEDKAYLTACLNKAGENTVTEQQYTQNKYKYGWSPQRTFLWILGQNDLFETGCLWTLISTPVEANLETTTLEKKYQTLETIWSDWYGWWKPKLSTYP
ncbi:cyanoexosortase A system-associated protein [Crocosphaera sp. UHCC 0190]|uniref:cyanoexosortase A system-associated protein n=1 Tax=Crocosphaera sp. UHCC 0190 TaxID=3110246 RepID=UPI002B217950|nr:cyanoexosortase A system-associated protein [Crocosphaera sp. UHCC 0190]MEA5508850.1 cyanoexosortase A system-associated protein [Crocosphaera sp. UHCC 0190]